MCLITFIAGAFCVERVPGKSFEMSVSQAFEFTVHFIQNPVAAFKDQWELHPAHIVIEIFFCALLAYFYMVPVRKAKRVKPVDPPTKKEQEEMLFEFKSEPFRSVVPDSNLLIDGCAHQLEVHARRGTLITVSGSVFKAPTPCQDYATFDYHSFATNPEIIAVAKKCVAAYGVGSCGPRGFYGTVKPHLDLEHDLSVFLGTEQAIIYSYSFATVSTLIPCFSSRGDYILCDDGACLPIQEGLVLSRSHVQYFPHNDVARLRALMEEIVEKEKRAKKISRRFVVTEGVFRNHGDMCNLPAILALCNQYKFRLILEDSFGFGAVGPTCRGTPEHFGVKMSDVDIYIGSLSNALGAVGGFCAGPKALVDHQRLAATGYVFSASLPPYISSCCSAVLSMLSENTKYSKNLKAAANSFRSEIRRARLAGVTMTECVDDASPIVYFRAPNESADAAERKFQAVVLALQAQKILAFRHIFTHEERVPVAPGLRVVVKSSFTEADAAATARVVAAALKQEFQ